jgi:diguanylate cyclase (GGDEF)-like protein
MVFCLPALAADEVLLHEQCVFKQLNSDTNFILAVGQKSQVTIPTGTSRFIINCNTRQEGVLSFLKSELVAFEWRQPDGQLKEALQATQPAYFMPKGRFSGELMFTTHHSYKPQFEWLSAESFIEKVQINNLLMGSFYGLCITLIFYVLILGRSLKDNTFKLYSAYICCAGFFFLLQEGQLSLFLQAHSYWLSHQFYLLSAGLTVFSATIFLIRLTDLQQTWPKLINRMLLPSAWSVLFLSILITLLEHSNWSALLGTIMAYMTLAIILVIFVLVARLTYWQVPDAWLVFIALSLVFVAMIFRILFPDISPTINRYGLIFAFAIESFILAVAVSERIKRLKKDKNLAETEANYDPLCNVLSRRGWSKHAHNLLEQQKLKGGMLGLLYIDLNKFKQVNDTHGHNVGDKVLQVVAKIIRNQIRESDALGRLGGDEFVVLGHFADITIFQALQQRVQTRLQHIPIHTQDANLEISASVGSVEFLAMPSDINELLKAGDKAMYAEKLVHHRLTPSVSN